MAKKTEKQEPLIWEKGKGRLEEFFEISRILGLNHIIYVIDARGKLHSVWSSSTEDLIESLYILSNKCYFGRVQSIENAIQYGFYDEIVNN